MTAALEVGSFPTCAVLCCAVRALTRLLRKFVIARERKKRLNGGRKGGRGERERERGRTGRENNCALKSVATTVGNIRSHRRAARHRCGRSVGRGLESAAAAAASVHTICTYSH